MKKITLHTFIHLFASGNRARVTVQLPGRSHKKLLLLNIHWRRSPTAQDRSEAMKWKTDFTATLNRMTGRRYRIVQPPNEHQHDQAHAN